MPGFLRVESQLKAKAAAAGVTQPTIVRVAEIGTRDSAATAGWVGNGAFDASGTESNRCLLVLACVFSNVTGSTWGASSVTIGGTGATLEAGFTNPAASRCPGVAIWSRTAPANNAALAVAWDITHSSDLDAGKIYGVLLQNANQADPCGATAGVNVDATSPAVVPITTLHDTSLLIGGFSTRGGDMHPLGASDGSTIEINGQTGTSNTISTAAAVASKAAATTGAHSLAVTLTGADRWAGTVVEVRGA